MKNHLFLLISLFTLICAKGQSDVRIDAYNLKWNLNIEKAKELSKVSKKPMLIYFTGSDWCSACTMLKKDYFSQKEFKKIAHKFILFEADFPKDKSKIDQSIHVANRQLKNQFKITGFPTTIIVDKNGNVIGRIVGHRLEKTKKIYTDFVNAILSTLY